MSGGRWNYSNDHCCSDLFDWIVGPDYDMGDESYDRNVKCARRINPMEDKQMSELVYDVFCVLHSCDWYKSGDTCKQTYLDDVKFFKNKWLDASASELSKTEIDKAVQEMKDELYVSFGLKSESEE